MTIYGGPDIITDGLVLHLDAGNSKSYPGSGTSWFDLSGNNNNGTLTNGPTYSSINKGQIILDGINDYIQFNLSSFFQFGTNDFCFEYWIYPISKLSLYPPLFVNYDNGFGPGAIFIGLDHDFSLNKYSLYINGSGSGAITNANIIYNKWAHLVAVRDSGICKLYLNGIQDGTTINATGIVLNGKNTSVVRVGSGIDFSSFYNGRISMMRVYNRTLTSIEVLKNYNALKGRYGL